MKRLEMKNLIKIIIEKQQKYSHFYQLKLANMSILQVNKDYLLTTLNYPIVYKRIPKIDGWNLFRNYSYNKIF